MPDQPAEQPADAVKLRLGGMALRNGLLVHGPTRWAAAIRLPGGGLRVASGRKPRLRALDGVPGARGLARLGEALAVLPLLKRELPDARLPFESASVAGAAAVAAAAGGLLRRAAPGVVSDAANGALALAPSLLALRDGELAAYHGAEHKAIGAYEHGAADARDAPKEHDRCGSNLIAPLLACNVLGAALVRRAGARPGPVAGGVVALASMAAAVEIFGWSERHSETRLARALRRPGHALQKALGTREPDERQLEVGRAALAEILRVEHPDARTEGAVQECR